METKKSFLLISLLVLGGIAFLMLEPFIGYIIGAALIAFLLRPLHTRLSSYIHEKASAIILVFLSIFLAIFPFIFAATAVVDDARDVGNNLDTSNVVNISEIETQIKEMTGREVDISKNIDAGVDRFINSFIGGFSQVLSFLTGLAIGLTLMLFLIYYMILDGDKFVESIREFIPMDPEVEERLFSDIERTTWAVIKGHVLVAVVQGAVAGIGLFVTGIPNPVFWTFVMVLLGFIPIVGTIVVWVPAAIYLYLTGEILSAVFLVMYGLIVVGLTDNILRPLAVDRKAKLHPAVILIGVIGGVYLFGAVGLFIGPILLGILKSVFLAVKNNY